MMDQIDNQNVANETEADVLLKQLLQLKRYETPDPSRMTKNKQNIMRLVREANSNKRMSLGDLMELNMPWFFAEPRYGIALLFVAFSGLQLLSQNRFSQMDSRTGIYTTSGNMVSVGKNVAPSTNNFYYSQFPADAQLFDGQHVETDVKFVGRIEKK